MLTPLPNRKCNRRAEDGCKATTGSSVDKWERKEFIEEVVCEVSERLLDLQIPETQQSLIQIPQLI